MKRFATRRDACHFIGKRAATLQPREAAAAWIALAEKVEALGEADIPKFNELLTAIRNSTITAKRIAANRDEWAEYLGVLDYDT